MLGSHLGIAAGGSTVRKRISFAPKLRLAMGTTPAHPPLLHNTAESISIDDKQLFFVKEQAKFDGNLELADPRSGTLQTTPGLTGGASASRKRPASDDACHPALR